MTFGLLRLLTILDRVPLPILPAFSSQCSQPLTLDLAAPAAFHLSQYYDEHKEWSGSSAFPPDFVTRRQSGQEHTYNIISLWKPAINLSSGEQQTLSFISYSCSSQSTNTITMSTAVASGQVSSITCALFMIFITATN
jgi:hypothetical protein